MTTKDTGLSDCIRLDLPERVMLYVDDVREVPDDRWTLARTNEEAIAILETGRVWCLSLDHDMGIDPDGDIGDVITTRPIVFWMIENDVWPVIFDCHSSNPYGRQWIFGMVDTYGPMGPRYQPKDPETEQQPSQP